jgi:hypothetical protein
LVLDQGSAPERAAGRAWPGAAVFCKGLLAAVVVRDDRAFGNRRLRTVSASALTPLLWRYKTNIPLLRNSHCWSVARVSGQ